jgi:hypothetical protein
MAEDSDFLFYPESVRGPLALFKGALDREGVETAASITTKYCNRTNGEPVKITYRQKNSDTEWSVVAPAMDEKDLTSARI